MPLRASAVRSFCLAEHCSRSRSVWTAAGRPAPLSLQRLQSGTTGVCALIAGKTLHVAWLGDSQVILVQQGQVVKLMEPHRPERQVRAPSLSAWDSPSPRHAAPRKIADGQVGDE